MKIERKKRPTRLECALYSKDYYDRCVEINTKYKQTLEEHPSLDDSAVSMIKEIMELNDISIERCKEIFNSLHRTRREEWRQSRRLRKH